MIAADRKRTGPRFRSGLPLSSIASFCYSFSFCSRRVSIGPGAWAWSCLAPVLPERTGSALACSSTWIVEGACPWTVCLVPWKPCPNAFGPRAAREKSWSCEPIAGCPSKGSPRSSTFSPAWGIGAASSGVERVSVRRRETGECALRSGALSLHLPTRSDPGVRSLATRAGRHSRGRTRPRAQWGIPCGGDRICPLRYP